MEAAAPSSILLYRYLDAAAALKTIESRSFRISRIKDLNDPFEWRFGYKGHNLDDEAAISRWREAVLESQDNRLGILCFSKTVKDPVLWSHYADKHKGVAFEVDHFNDPRFLRKVSYPPERIVIDIPTYARLRHDAVRLEEYLRPMFERLAEQKSPSWEYEDEYRVLFSLQEDRKLRVEDGHYHVEIPHNFLLRVILGWKCPLNENDVIAALKQVGLDSTKVVRAKISNDTYDVFVERRRRDIFVETQRQEFPAPSGGACALPPCRP
jgi:hypothetical protein